MQQASPPEGMAHCCFSIPGAITQQPSVDTVALFHYATKSRADFDVKMARGSGMSNATKTIAYFDKIAGCALQPR